ncbi:MAG: diguanylate cyclase [Spirochaetales bacterium]|nr:diguanylate cyclase [Spirochaetales bacterium]
MKQQNLADTQEPIGWRKFIVSITLLVLLFCLGLFIGLFMRNKQLIEQELLSRARAHFDSVVLTRSWNAAHGGVYVEKKPGVESNPYLQNPDITTTDGRIFTKKNPALMTREISEIAHEKGMFLFHITSLNPLNPGNKPDKKEREALESFEVGGVEAVWQDSEGGSILYGYMAPLITNESCLTCHAKQGYKVGDLRGGISVKFDVSEVQKAVKRDFKIILTLGILTALTLLGVIYYMIHRLIRAVSDAHGKIKIMAITDELTGLINRRHFFELMRQEYARTRRYGYQLGCLMLDLDHFKSVNDTYGHPVGDIVLQQVGKILGSMMRETDIPARYGGEEFVCILPQSDLEGCKVIAEKVRGAIEAMEIPLEDGRTLTITASIGVALMSEGMAMEQLIKCADAALYTAKDTGRNRVEVYHEPQ